jgi:hypothetical protein
VNAERRKVLVNFTTTRGIKTTFQLNASLAPKITEDFTIPTTETNYSLIAKLGRKIIEIKEIPI